MWEKYAYSRFHISPSLTHSLPQITTSTMRPATITRTIVISSTAALASQPLSTSNQVPRQHPRADMCGGAARCRTITLTWGGGTSRLATRDWAVHRLASFDRQPATGLTHRVRGVKQGGRLSTARHRHRHRHRRCRHRPSLTPTRSRQVFLSRLKNWGLGRAKHASIGVWEAGALDARHSRQIEALQDHIR